MMATSGWAICLVTLSARKEPGYVHIVMQDDNTRYNLNAAKKLFEPVKHKKLTKREKEILECIATGYNTSSIAGKLGISESTVKNHKSLFQKLNARSSAEAAFYASKQNMI